MKQLRFSGLDLAAFVPGAVFLVAIFLMKKYGL